MKRRIANSIMVFAILLIAFSGVMAVGSVKGWFDKEGDPKTFTVADKVGEASIERSGIAYSLQKGTILKKGDRIETISGSSFHFKRTDSDIIVNENTKLRITANNQSKLGFQLEKGEVYIRRISNEVALDVIYGKDGTCLLSWQDAKTAVSLDVQDGTQSVHVLSGSISITYPEENVEVSSGNSFSSVVHRDGKIESTVQKYSVEALDDFVLQQALKFNEDDTLCFQKNTITAVLNERKQEQKDANEELLTLDKKVVKKEDTMKNPEVVVSEPDEEKKENASKEKIQPTKEAGKKNHVSNIEQGKKDNKTPEAGSTTLNPQIKNSHNENAKEGNSQKEKDNTKKQETTKTETKEPSPSLSKDAEKQVFSCTISISCSSILDHTDQLKESKTGYVPSDGNILSTTKVEFTEGETVYDILKRVCDTLGIQMEASYTPIYKSYYVEGIHNLYEFDCGKQSGWMYKVNGWYPNYGCSSYKVKDGDAIVWNYTCEGLGADVS